MEWAFLVSVEPIFKKFLCFFQSEGPLIHLLHHTMCELLKSLMGRFLKTHVLGEKEGKHLLTIDYSKPDNQLSMSQMEVGEKLDQLCPSCLMTNRRALLGMKQFYVDATNYLIGHLSSDNKLLRDVSFLHSVRWDSKHEAQAIRRLAVMMPTLSEEVALITDEWKAYQAGQVDEESATTRAYHYWADVFQEKSLQGQCKYSVLQKLVEGLLCLAHGNADVEKRR